MTETPNEGESFQDYAKRQLDRVISENRVLRIKIDTLRRIHDLAAFAEKIQRLEVQVENMQRQLDNIPRPK